MLYVLFLRANCYYLKENIYFFFKHTTSIVLWTNSNIGPKTWNRYEYATKTWQRAITLQRDVQNSTTRSVFDDNRTEPMISFSRGIDRKEKEKKHWSATAHGKRQNVYWLPFARRFVSLSVFENRIR